MKQVTDPYLTKTYGSTRLLFGLASIGWNLLLVWGLFLVSWGGGAYHPNPAIKNMLWLVPAVFAGLLLANLPWDAGAGYYLEKKAGRYDGRFGDWFRQWLAGGLLYGLLQTVGGYLFALWIFGYSFALVVVLLIPGILAAARIWQFYLIPQSLKAPGIWPEGYEKALRGELKKLGEPWPEDLFLYRSEDGSTLNGGRVGMGGHSRLMISDSSAQALSPRELALLIMREERYLGWSSGQKHFHYGLGWGLLGVLVSIPGIALLDLTGISSWLWMLAALTTWHCLGLVILPGIARRQVLRVDSEMVSGNVSKREYVLLLKKLQSYNWTPSHVMAVTEILFYSIPSLETRLNRLDRL